MHKSILIFLFILAAISCGAPDGERVELAFDNDAADMLPSATPEEAKQEKEIIEFFSDEKTIGKPGKNKIEISCTGEVGGQIAEIKFYTRVKANRWKLKQAFELKRDTGMPCQPEIADLNGDGFMDFTYISRSVARGANEMRKLLIYDKRKNELLVIENSDEFPNLEYNEKLKCIDAWAFSGSITTIFLKLEGNRLREFASVDVRDRDRTVSIVGKDGKSRVVRRDKVKTLGFPRFENFDPPEDF